MKRLMVLFLLVASAAWGLEQSTIDQFTPAGTVLSTDAVPLYQHSQALPRTRKTTVGGILGVHTGAADPHTQYYNQARGDGRYSLIHSHPYQPLDADLTTYAGITPSANVQSLLAAADWAAMRLLLGIGTYLQPYDDDLVDLADGTLSEDKIDPLITRDSELATHAATQHGTTAQEQTDIANGATAYSWGDHAGAGYITTILGTEAAFTGWDKNASDDFSGAYADLTGKPTVVTTIGTPGSDANFPSEQAVREGLDAVQSYATGLALLQSWISAGYMPTISFNAAGPVCLDTGTARADLAASLGVSEASLATMVKCDTFAGTTISLTGYQGGIDYGVISLTGEAAIALVGLDVGSTLGPITATAGQVIGAAGIDVGSTLGAVTLTNTGALLAGIDGTVTLGSITLEESGTATIDLTGINVALTRGAVTLTGAAGDHTTTWETGNDGWTLVPGPDTPATPWGRVTGQAHGGTYAFALSGTDDGAEGYTDGYIEQTFANVTTGNITLWGKAFAPSTQVKVYRNGVLISTSTFTTASYEQKTIAITGGTNITIKIESNFSTSDGTYIDDIVIPGGG